MNHARRRTLTALAAVGALAFAGCADDDSDSAEGTGAPEATDDVEDNGGGTEPGGTGEAPDAPEAPESDIAASVGSTEIPVTTVDGVYEELTSLPAVEEQLQEADGDQLQASLRSQILGQLVVQEVIMQAAEEDHGVTTTQEDIDAALAEFTDQAGGEEELDTQLASSGLTRQAFLELQLPLTVTFRELQTEFGIDSPTPEGEELSDEERELQSWSTETLEQADVEVDAYYGTWNATAGQIEPPGTPTTSVPPAGDGAPSTSEPSSGGTPAGDTTPASPPPPTTG